MDTSGYKPTDEGAKVMIEALGENKPLEVVPAMEVARAVATRQVSPALLQTMQKEKGRVLLVCMSGNNSLKMAQLLVEKGIRGQSLIGGISAIARDEGKQVLALVRPA